PTDADRMQLAPMLARFLKHVHAHQATVPDELIGRLDKDRLLTSLTRNLPKLQGYGLIDDAEAWLATARRHYEIPVTPERFLVHGDIYVRHLLLDPPHRLVGVIDWGDVHMGHRAVDFAIAHSFLPPPARQIFRAEYGAIDDASWDLAHFRSMHHT